MKAIYYMPLLLKEWAMKTGNTRIIDFCQLFNLLNPNACIIDRTGSFDVPFETHVLYPIPAPGDFHGLTFADECRRQATSILMTNQEVRLLYSGGLDSTTVLMAFYEAIQAGCGSFDQVTVAATPFSIIENPEAWHRYVLPNFKLEFAGDAFVGMADPQLRYVRYVTGENGDQLFGSDVLIHRMHLFTTPITIDEVRSFVASRGVIPTAVDGVAAMLWRLYENRHMELRSMADLIWWLNFSSKWQSVALRYLAFTNFLEVDSTLASLDRLGTFFNTPQFQWLSLHGGIARYGSPPSAKNYKLEMRRYLGTFPNLRDYAANKVKVPSLYRLFSVAPAKYSVLAVDDTGQLVSLKHIEDLLDSNPASSSA